MRCEDPKGGALEEVRRSMMMICEPTLVSGCSVVVLQWCRASRVAMSSPGGHGCLGLRVCARTPTGLASNGWSSDGIKVGERSAPV